MSNNHFKQELIGNIVLDLTPTNFIIFKRPGHEVIGTIHVKQVYEIAKIKQRDEHLKRLSLENICKTIVGSAKSMGVEVVAD